MGASTLATYMALSEYTKSMVGLTVDELLTRACLSGRLPGLFAGFAKIDAERVHSFVQCDGPELWTYRGRLTVQGVTFSFECVICCDPVREVYAIEVLNIEPVEWTTRVVMA